MCVNSVISANVSGNMFLVFSLSRNHSMNGNLKKIIAHV